MSCLCGHFESCKHCSPYYDPKRDPVWLRERLAEAHALLVRCQRGFDWNQYDDAEQNQIGRDLDAWLGTLIDHQRPISVLYP